MDGEQQSAMCARAEKSTAVVASIGDVVLYEADVATLEPCGWLGDLVIAFFFELFAARLAGGEGAELAGAIAAPATTGVVLLEPTVSYMAAVLGSSEALREALSVPHTPAARPLTDVLADASMVLLPVCDKSDPDSAVGGSHWSLLAFRRVRGNSRGEDAGVAFEHYDSAGSANAHHAQAVASVLAPLVLGKELTSPSCLEIKLHEMHGPQQVNGHDCGVYTVATAEILCGLSVHDMLPTLGTLAPALSALTPEFIERKRLELLHTVRAMARSMQQQQQQQR